MDDERLLKLLKALAEGNRLKIVKTVAAAGELSCGQIAERFPIAQATVSHHLKILLEARLLDVRREGQFGYFTLNQTVTDQLRAAIYDLLPGLTTEEIISPNNRT